MDKEEALSEFLRGFRIIINNASAYPKDHPYFVKSVDTFKQKVGALFLFLNPIKIDIAPGSLFMDGRFLQKNPLYIDLASMFHLRKIKSIEFKQGLSTQELVDFLSLVSLPIREILKRGGLGNILPADNTRHFSVTELDYSELLRDGQEETKDIWGYLFKEAMEASDTDKVNRLADNFEEIVGKFQAKYFLEDGELRENTCNFLNYLKSITFNQLYTLHFF
mgnify:CR=1 FL=1